VERGWVAACAVIHAVLWPYFCALWESLSTLVCAMLPSISSMCTFSAFCEQATSRHTLRCVRRRCSVYPCQLPGEGSFCHSAPGITRTVHALNSRLVSRLCLKKLLEVALRAVLVTPLPSLLSLLTLRWCRRSCYEHPWKRKRPLCLYDDASQDAPVAHRRLEVFNDT